MIKINLLKNSGLTQGGTPTHETPGLASNDIKKAAFGKLAAIVALPILLYAYERSNISEVTETLNHDRQRLDVLVAEKAQYGETGPRVEKLTKEKQKIDAEVEVIRGLARNRLREVKTLDAIQSLMPDQTWAKKISIDANLVKIEGLSSIEEGVTNLIRALDGSAFFSRVEPKSVAREGEGKDQFKKFEIEFRIGKSD